MKKVILCALTVFFLAAGYAGTRGYGRPPSGTRAAADDQQQTSTTASAKSQAQPASKQTSKVLVAQKRLCDGLKRFKGKILQIEESLSEANRSHNDYMAAAAKIKKEALIPLFEKTTITKQAFQEKPVLIPAEKILGQVQVLQDLKKVRENVRRIRGSLRQQLDGLRKDWEALEPGLKQATGSSSAPSPERLCASQEAKAVGRELAVMGSQAGNLQSQIDDLRAQLDKEFAQAPCASGPPDCLDCMDCCAWQNRITAPVDSLERTHQELERHACEISCAQSRAACLWDICLTILKDISETSTQEISQLNHL